ncbi:MAG: tetratricopeptide repeat protein [Nitrospiraceae bacterium]|nr:tetratricopeptide repeat protein [Nitrospiraceae bacterium]
MKALFAGAVVVLVLMVTALSFAGNEDLEKGIRYYRGRDFRHAEISLRKYVAEIPDPVGYYLLGYAEYKLKKFGDSKKHFSEAYLIDPDISPKVDEMMKKREGR